MVSDRSLAAARNAADVRPREIQRRAFAHGGLTLFYLESGGAKPLVAPHADWMEAATFTSLADALPSEWRTIALDRCGSHSEEFNEQQVCVLRYSRQPPQTHLGA